ncbi:MAG: hypothetical protein D3917_12180 [Candidatus Electrothrix sp. AX5]|nr:hypothetical protein [Candidatus Electrothrix sp. AX5]
MLEKKPDYKLKVSVKGTHSELSDVLCEVYLPQRVTESIKLKFHLGQKIEHDELRNFFKFSFYKGVEK